VQTIPVDTITFILYALFAISTADIILSFFYNTKRVLLWYLPLAYLAITIMFYLRTYDSCQIKITLLHIYGTLLICAWLVKIIQEKKVPLSGFLPLALPLVFFLISGTVSYMHSPFKAASFMDFLRRFCYVSFALIIMDVFSDEKQLKRLFGFVIAACTISSVYGLIQFLDINFYPPGPTGLDPFIWRKAFGSRVFSTHGNPNFFGDFLVVMTPILLAQIIRARNPFHIFLFILVSFNVAVTGSKAAWIGYTAGVTSFIFVASIYFSHAKKEIIKKYATIAIVALLIVCSIGVAYYTKQRTDSAKFRIYTWMSTWEMILKRPWFGSGIGTFFLTYPKYRRPQIFFVEGRHNTETDHPEDEYLEVWYDEGLVGFGIFIWLVVTFLSAGFKRLRQYTNFNQDNSGNDPPVKKEKNKQQMKLDPRAYLLLGVLSSLLGLLAHNLMCVSLRFVSSGIFIGFIFGTLGALIGPSEKSADNKNLAVPLLQNKVFSFISQVVIVLTALYCVNVYRGLFIADKEHNIAIYFSKRGDWNTALEHYNNVKKYNPYFIMTHYFMGNVFNDRFNMEKTFHPEWGDLEPRDDTQRALWKYNDVKRSAPNYVQVHHQTGLVYMKLGEYYAQRNDPVKAKENYEKALENFEKYRTIDPIFDQNYSRMAYVYMKLGNPQKVEEMYKAHLNSPLICKTGPHNIMWEDWGKRRYYEHTETSVNLGNFYYLQNRFPEAEQAYVQATKLGPKNTHAWRNLMILRMRLGRSADAVAAGRTVLEYEPNNEDIKKLLASLGVNF